MISVALRRLFPRSSMVERLPVKEKVVGSNPIGGAHRLNYKQKGTQKRVPRGQGN